MHRLQSYIGLLARRATWWAAIAGALLSFGCTAKELTQAELENVDTLVKQHKSASRAQKSEAAQLLREADSVAKARKWDLSAKIYVESAIRFPTFRALKGWGEATAKSDLKRPTSAETLSAHKAAFEGASHYLRIAVQFAEKVPGQAQPTELEAVRQQIKCIESYSGSTRHNCEPVRSVLLRYATLPNLKFPSWFARLH